MSGDMITVLNILPNATPQGNYIEESVFPRASSSFGSTKKKSRKRPSTAGRVRKGQ